MKRITLLLLILLAGLTTVSAQVVGPDDPTDNNAMASKKRRDKQPKQEEKIDTKKADAYNGTVYMFGVAAQFGDTTVYVTELRPVEGVQLTKKYDFLRSRNEFAYELKHYLADNYGGDKLTCAVFYDPKLKKAQKRYAKVLKRYETGKNKLHVVHITQDQFKFTLPEYPNL